LYTFFGHKASVVSEVCLQISDIEPVLRYDPGRPAQAKPDIPGGLGRRIALLPGARRRRRQYRAEYCGQFAIRLVEQF